CLCAPMTSISTGREDTENIKTKFNPNPQYSLSLSNTHTHLFSCKYFTSNNFLLAIKQNEAHLSRASHFLCRHRRSSHASHR
ncbi:hypothetical protein E4U52_000564, partial [Claviceps spartinae]